MLRLSALGGFLLAVTVLIHAIGCTYWVRHLIDRFSGQPSPWRATLIMRALVMTVFVLLALHLIEVAIWAVAYSNAQPPGHPWTFETALYFSFVTFTTLGYGDITLGPDLRLLSGIEALNGILLVGLSTALLLAVMQRVWAGGTKGAA